MGAEPVSSVSIDSTTFSVYKSQLDDVNEARVYIWSSELRAGIENRRRAACLSVGVNRAYCEVLFADRDYVDRRLNAKPTAQDHFIFMNGWTRHILGIEQNAGAKLTVVFSPWAPLNMCIDHPQMVVSIAMLSSLVGLVLGVLGIGLALAAFKELPSLVDVGLGVTAIAFIALCLVFVRFTKRLWRS